MLRDPVITMPGTNGYKTINFPYYMYPGTPFKGYWAAEYNDELYRLDSAIRFLGNQTLGNFLFHLTIGAPMEEAGIDILQNHDALFQLHQLIPDHLIRAAHIGINVLNFIVCPNKLIVPLFMTLTDDFIKINTNEYKHNILPIKICVFNTMMPTKDVKRNAKYMDHFEKNGFESYFPHGVQIYRQTVDDQHFVDEFYHHLCRTIKTIINCGGYCSCFSFAVFNDDSEHRNINSYSMFKEIIKCYQDKQFSLLREWVFRYNTYVVYDVENKSSICYVPVDKLSPILGPMTLSYHVIVPYRTLTSVPVAKGTIPGKVCCDLIPAFIILRDLITTHCKPSNMQTDYFKWQNDSKIGNSKSGNAKISDSNAMFDHSINAVHQDTVWLDNRALAPAFQEPRVPGSAFQEPRVPGSAFRESWVLAPTFQEPRVCDSQISNDTNTCAKMNNILHLQNAIRLHTDQDHKNHIPLAIPER
jgi:hypothetical protein